MGDEEVTLVPEEVHTAAQAETVRVMRNHCRTYMTHDRSHIEPEQQAAWWDGLDKTANRLVLFHAVNDAWSTAAGYGLCRFIDGKWWVSGGLLKDWRGRGFGKLLFGHLLTLTGSPCWLDVFETNEGAIKTYLALGFERVSSENGVITMVKR